MRYTNKQYANSLLDALKEKKGVDAQEIIKNFLNFLRKNGDWAKRREIAREIERSYFRLRGIHRVEVESAGAAPASLKKEIEDSLGKNIVLEEKVNPGILGGIKIMIDDEILVDASARTQLNRMFEKA